ncbi:hypothetical protein [Polyangium aurulentum]|uniref:hypothetical protein n=1 Tax=Polyangium aurulentum TaxID=2567896 RepID=UPI0010AE1E04|nr:hypothetical protein [Polyangium aurulentum]UQA54976.1 hypothetical protein E8A73_026855 [Polyangium aurulentum]
MRRLTLSDLDLGLRSLLEERKADLDLSAAGNLYGPMLAERLAAIQALPEALRRRPLAGKLAAADTHHDGFGGGIWSYTEAVLHAPDLDDDVKAAAQRIRDAFIPERSALTASYADEASKAKKNRPKLEMLEADLKAFPLPKGKTLHDWVTGFLDAGDTLDTLLDQRSQTEGNANGKANAGSLRSDTLGVLNEFRATLRREIKHNPKLPADLESRIFSYLDELNARRKPKKDGGEEPPAGEKE